MPDPGLSPSQVQVNLDALARNVLALKGLTRPGTRFLAVIKANAYGHGAVAVARTALDNGADFLGVARLSEALDLRRAGFRAPILLFGQALRDHAPLLRDQEIRATVTDLETARNLAGQADSPPLKLHVKVDTGMGRLGLVAAGPGDHTDPVAETILRIHQLPGIEVEGLYTHLARADELDLSHAKEQLHRFQNLICRLESLGIRPEICHAANSAGLIALPESHLDMVRPGITLYGLWPSQEMDRSKLDLTPAMTIKTRIIQVKAVPAGFKVGYGATHVTSCPTTIATVPLGYADGYSRLLSNQGEMLVRGQKARILGRVCMDFTMIDVGSIKGARVGDEVVALGSQHGTRVTADDIARLTGTINYEVTARLSGRLPLVYTPERT